MSIFAIALAAVAGLSNAAGDLLERGSARNEDTDPHESVRLVGRLARRPRWLLGLLASLVGLALHITALSHGQLAVVQPVLVVELPLAVLGSAWFFGRRLARRDWLAVVMMSAGLAAFLYFLAPSGGDRMRVSGTTWAVGVALVLAAALALAWSGWRAQHDLRACLLATASGVGYGLTGVFFSTAAAALAAGGLPAVLATWQTWASAITGGAAFYLLQNALSAGRLVAVEPGVTLANPLVATTWGLVVFGEAARPGPALLGAGLGAALVAGGVVILAGSPALQNHRPGAERRAPVRR